MTEQEFLENLIKNLKKNGYPEKKVSLPLDRLYESAHQKSLNFNKILAACRQQGIDHEKTSTKIIFFPKAEDDTPTSFDFSKQNPFLKEGFPFGSMDQMMSQAQEMIKKMSPAQLDDIKKMIAKMSPEEREELVKKAKEMGLREQQK